MLSDSHSVSPGYIMRNAILQQVSRVMAGTLGSNILLATLEIVLTGNFFALFSTLKLSSQILFNKGPP